MRVELNRLLPPEMKSEVELPSRNITEVELEYLKIEKHCFKCFSLAHEEIDCPRRTGRELPAKERKLGITQALALERIEADKRRHDERRGYRPPDHRQTSQRPEANHRPRQSLRYSDNRASQVSTRRDETNDSKLSDFIRPSTGRRNTDYRQKRSRMEYIPRTESNLSRSIPELRNTKLSSKRNTNRDTSPGVQAGSSATRRNASPSVHTPSPNPIREIGINIEEPVVASDATRSRERRSALERVEAPNLRDQLRRRSTPSGDSGRLMEVEVLYNEEPHQSPILLEDNEQNARRSSALQRLGGLSSLGSRERTRATLDIEGPIAVEPSASKQIGKHKIARATTKRIVAQSPQQGAARAPVKRKVAQSPLHGINLRKSKSTAWYH